MDAADIIRVRAEAEQSYQAGNYESALELYQALSNGNPYDSELQLRLGYCASRLGKLGQAIEALEMALTLGCIFPWNVTYELARLYARSGEKETSLNYLEQSLSGRWENRPAVLKEPDFESFHTDERFLRLVGAFMGSEVDRSAGWQFDLDYLVEEAQRLHVGFEQPAFSERFLAAAEALRHRIATLTNEAIVVEMQRLIALLGDGHSRVYGFLPTEKVQLLRLPVDFYSFRDGLFIVAGYDEAEPYVGSKVLQFGTRETKDIVTEIEAYISMDNAMTAKWLMPLFLCHPAYLHALGATETDTAATLTLQNQQNTIQEVSLKGNNQPIDPYSKLKPPPTSPAPALYLKNMNTNYWLQTLPDFRAIYIQYNQVRDAAHQSIAEFAEQLQKTIQTAGLETLIVDVRHNNGGNNFLNWPLIRTLIHFKTDKPAHRIFVLIGRTTFSACQNFVNWLERTIDVIFVGEPTGSRPNAIGESTNVVLPYSQVRASISSRAHYDSFWGDNRKWIAPHIPVEVSSDDYFSNRDPVLEMVLTLLK